MKGLFSAFVAALAISANATVAWEKIGGIQVADISGLTSAVVRLGEMSGNSMVGAMLAAKIMDVPSNGFFGPMRQGASLYFPLYVDSDKLAEAKDAEEFGNSVEHAVVYPMSLPRDEFLNLHPGAVETNGLLLVDGEVFSPEEEWDEDSQMYVAFSEDGKWAAVSDKPEQAVLALGDVLLALRPMDGDVVRVDVSPRGVAAFCKVLDGGESKELCSGLDGVSVALRIGDAGIDLHGFFKTVEGSMISKYGEMSLSGDPFAFDRGEAVAAFADSYSEGPGLAMEMESAMAVCKTNGLDLARFVSCVETSDVCCITVDMLTAINHFANPSNRVGEVDFEKLFDALANEGSKSVSINPAARASYCSIVFAGYKPTYPASQRFYYILPELKNKPLCYAGTYSICASIQACFEAVLATLGDKERAEIAPMVALFPKESMGGMAVAYWREGSCVKFMFRLSSDELRRIVTGASAVFMYTMMREKDRRYKVIDDDCGEDCAFWGDDDCDGDENEDEDED